MFPVHAVLMCAACALLTAGALSMRFSVCSFTAHLRLQSLGTIIAAAGVLLGVQMTAVHCLNAHTVLGLVFVGVLTLQLVTAACFRPAPHHIYRRLWLLVHRVLALVMVVIEFLAVWTGLDVARFKVTAWHRAALIAVLTVVGCVWLGAEWQKTKKTTAVSVKSFDVTVDDIFDTLKADDV